MCCQPCELSHDTEITTCVTYENSHFLAYAVLIVFYCAKGLMNEVDKYLVPIRTDVYFKRHLGSPLHLKDILENVF